MNTFLSALFIICLFILGVKINSDFNVVGRLKQKKQKQELTDQVQLKLDTKVRNARSYFFTDDHFDFDKFCDYILCIRDDQDFNIYLDYLADMEILLNCSPQLRDKFLNLLLNSGAIIAIVGLPEEFEALKQSIRDKKFTGTYADLAYIYFSVVFYLKYKLSNAPTK